jgi:hypothetical protein
MPAVKEPTAESATVIAASRAVLYRDVASFELPIIKVVASNGKQRTKICGGG